MSIFLLIIIDELVMSPSGSHGLYLQHKNECVSIKKQQKLELILILKVTVN